MLRIEQMGTSMRQSVFGEGVIEGLKKWRATATRNKNLRALTNPYHHPMPSFDGLHLKNIHD